MTRRAFLLVAGIGLGACATPRPAQPADDSIAAAASSPHPADSLVLTAPGGIEVWFTAAREATSPAGEPCLERALEIRQNGSRRGVPLLYTREAPALLSPQAMRAVLYNTCTAGAAYRVDFATVSPKRLSP